MRFALLAALLLLFLGACSDAKFAKLAAKLKSKSSAKDSGSSEGEEKGGGPEEYAEAMNIIAENINKAAEKSEALVNEHMANVDKDPGSLITKEAMKSMVEANSFLPQKAGTKSILLQPGQGFNGFTDYQPSGWKVSETMSGPAEKEKEESEEEEKGVFSYPFGLGPVLMNQCTERNYSKTSPCYNSKLFDIEDTGCGNMMDTAGFIGVGFDGRGYYSADSRKTSLVQRVCANDILYLGKEVPDIMRVFGIYHTVAETKSFQSVDQYMKFIRHQAGLSNQKGLFTSEASKYSKASSFGANLGAIGSIVGAGIGAVVGGGAGAAMGAALGGAIGGSIGGGSGSGSGSSSSKEDAEAKSNVQQSASVNQQQGATQNFFAIMYVNVILYEITLDEVKPTDLTLSLLKDYMDLPPSYFSVGSDVKYQGFLLRWGTHFIRSGKFGGQLKVTKTCKTSQQLSSQEFARVSETEFKSMFSTLQSSYTQKSSSWSFLGFGGKKKSAEQKDTAKAKSEYQSQLEQENKQQQKMRQSEFTQTSVEAQGGTPEIAEALMDFYTPAFKQLFHDWLVSIKDYPKPFEFQLKSIHTLFDMRIDELFPSGDHNFGCIGGSKGEVDIKAEAGTKNRNMVYMDTRVRYIGKKMVEEKIEVKCKYSNREQFTNALDRRRISLERAIATYMVEGPFPTSSAKLPAGEVGCEAATLAKLGLTNNASDIMAYSELKSGPFLLTFDLPQDVPNIATRSAKFRMIYSSNRWFASDPEAKKIHLYDGCMIGDLPNKVCFRNLIFTYEESSGFFYIAPKDFQLSKQLLPLLPNWLAGATIARPKRIQTAEKISKSVSNNEIFVPCNVKWLNSHRLDPNREENCIHFTAATEGSIFIIFSSIPRDHNTWYYLQISPEGAAFYQGMKLEKREVEVGMGVLGDKNLFQPFFVCVTQKKKSVLMQYGKADPDSEVGTVYSSYMFRSNSAYSRLSFFAFGSGEKEVSLMEIRLTKVMPKVECLNDNYIKVDGHCVLDCDPECDGCTNAKSNKACHQCKNVRVEKGSGGTKEVECLPECPIASYKSETKEKLCVPCPAGLFKDKKGNQKCTKCSPGSFSAEGAEKCTPCSSGTFNDKEGQSSCQNCAGGTFSRSSGAKKCDSCPLGAFSESGKSQCDPCPYGHYGDTTGLAKCKPCASGYFNDKRGQTTCQKCPAGTSSAAGSRTCANSCPKGQFSPREGVPCSDCPPGTISEGAGSSSCTNCKPGSYQPTSGQSACISAPRGSFVSETAAKAAQKCPAGTFNDKTGQSSRSVCTSCSAGTYSPEGSTSCTPCPKGSYQRSAGQPSCQKASAGHNVDATGQREQRQCEPGTFSSGSGAVACSQCPKGHFASSSGATACTKCPAGTFGSHEGLRTCEPCPAGKYSSSLGSTSCSACSGTVGTGSTSCSTGVNLKLSGCQQSSLYKSSTTCEKAIDGNTNQILGSGSCQVTTPDAKPWWSARTEDIANINKVKIYNRVDCCQDRLDNFEIRVDDKVCATSSGVFRIKEFDCNAVGSKITIVSRKSTYLTLCEVQVTGELIKMEQLKLSRCSQASTYGSGSCERAIDGNTNQDWYANSCTHTSGSTNDWWYAYTSATAQISKVKIFNRGDCCQDRLDNFEIRVDDKVCATSTGNFKIKEFDCKGVGTKITIASRKKTPITLCEVQVTGALL